MRYLRIAALLLALLLTVAAALPLAGCGQDSIGDAPTQDGADSETAPAPRHDLALIQDRDTDYVIIYPEDSSPYIRGIAKSLRETLIQRYGLSPTALRTRSDRTNTEAADDDALEILIGMTNRRESRSVAEALEPNSYVITSAGNKLVILGTDEYRTAEAIGRFLTDFTEHSVSSLIFSAESYVRENLPVREVELAENATLRVMSWNLQCPASDSLDLFTAMQNGINYYGADIIGLQECNANAHRGVVDPMRHLYAVATTYHEGTDTYDYTPILYKPERLDLLESGVEWLD
jgi:hypothetical protein